MKTRPLAFITLVLSLFVAAQSHLAAQTHAPAKLPPADTSQIYNLKEVDVQPAPRGKRAEPVYPYAMYHDKITGDVILQFVIDIKGVPQDLKVVRSTNKEFEKAAMDAVKQWRFRPAQKSGKPVPCRMRIPIKFNFS